MTGATKLVAGLFDFKGLPGGENDSILMQDVVGGRDEETTAGVVLHGSRSGRDGRLGVVIPTRVRKMDH